MIREYSLPFAMSDIDSASLEWGSRRDRAFMLMERARVRIYDAIETYGHDSEMMETMRRYNKAVEELDMSPDSKVMLTL
jgi:hypothetical protein